MYKYIIYMTQYGPHRVCRSFETDHMYEAADIRAVKIECIHIDRSVFLSVGCNIEHFQN